MDNEIRYEPKFVSPFLYTFTLKIPICVFVFAKMLESLGHLVDNVEHGLGTYKLVRITTSAVPLASGLGIFSKGNIITDAIVDINQDLFTSLTRVNANHIRNNLNCNVQLSKWT